MDKKDKHTEMFEMLQAQAMEMGSPKVEFSMEREDGWTWTYSVKSPDANVDDEDEDDEQK